MPKKKKRSQGQGSVHRLPSGNWRGEIMDGYTNEGKRNIVRFNAPTKAEVMDMIRYHQNQVEADIHVSKKLTLKQWAETWYVDYESQVQPSTYANYKYTMQLLIKGLGDKLVSDILPLDINRFLDNVTSQGYSLSQVRKCRTMLIQIFDSADNNGLVVRNPARRAKTVRDKGDFFATGKKDAFTDQEVAVLVETLPQGLLRDSILTMLGTGLRVQELLALTKEDIAEDGSTISITKAIKTVGGVPTLGSPKSRLSYRTVPVPADYREVVCNLRNSGGAPHLWSASVDSPHYAVGTFRRRFATALNAVEGVRKLTPHCCRHTYITKLQANGVPMETIARLAGHSSTETTAVYLHQSSETLASAVAVLNQKEESV